MSCSICDLNRHTIIIRLETTQPNECYRRLLLQSIEAGGYLKSTNNSHLDWIARLRIKARGLAALKQAQSVKNLVEGGHGLEVVIERE